MCGTTVNRSYTTCTGMQGVIERVGLNNSGLLLQVEVWLVVGLIGWGSGWFRGE